MSRFPLRRLLPALLLAVLALAATPAEAQQERPIRRREIERAQAANLYDLLAALRPEWLAAGGDTTDLAQARVLVLIGGVPSGTLAGLRVHGTEDAESVHLETPEEFHQRGRQRVDRYAAVLLVEPLDPYRPRVFVVGSLGTADRTIANEVETHLRSNGYGRIGIVLTRNYEPRSEWMLGAGLRFAGPFSVEAVMLWNEGLVKDGIDVQDVVQIEMDVTELSFPVTVQRSVLRVGVGPAVRLSRWEWMSGNCRCEEVTTGSSRTVGWTTLAAVGAGRGRLYAEGRVQASFFPAGELDAYRSLPRVEVGRGRTFFGAVGVGFRL